MILNKNGVLQALSALGDHLEQTAEEEIDMIVCGGSATRMLPESLSLSVSEDLLRFLWRQWSQLGLAGDVESRDSWIIDPEALLIFTMDAGRCDPRLFDEVLDWTVRNRRWISVQRLKNVSKCAGDDAKRALSAVASVVDSYDTKRRWRSIARIPIPSADNETPFFMDGAGKALPVIGDVDPHFAGVGFVRQRVEIRGLSSPVPMGPPTNLLFKLRSLVGMSPRAEVVAYLLTHANGRASVIARSTVYSHPSVHDTLEELAQGGLTYVEKRGLFSIDAERWYEFLGVESRATWVAWPRVFAAISALARFLAEYRPASVSDYLLRSRILTLAEVLREKLWDSGIANPFLVSCSLDEAVESLPRQIGQLMNELNPVERASSPPPRFRNRPLNR